MRSFVTNFGDEMSTVGKGVAIAGVWIGAGIICFSPFAAGEISKIVGAATTATFFIAIFS